ncbi:hypothetical protein F5888DRAFT_1804872 [Russula emetica]|nr:hypothetical protein F5888DRAFT_1804872 [Russula emetica]
MITRVVSQPLLPSTPHVSNSGFSTSTDVSAFVSPDEPEELSRLACEFFGLPQEEKYKISLNNHDCARGEPAPLPLTPQTIRENVTSELADNHEAIDLPSSGESRQGKATMGREPVAVRFRRPYDRLLGRHASGQHKKGQRSNGVGLGFGFGHGMGSGTGEETDTNVDSAPRSARPPGPRVHLRTASRSPSSAQSMASSSVNTGGSRMSRMSTLRLLVHGRAVTRSIDRAAAPRAAASASSRTKPRSSTTTTTTTIPASASATLGFRDPLVVRREENEARAKAAPLKVVTGKTRAPDTSWRVGGLFR